MRREAAALCALALIVCAPAAVNAAPEKHWVASWASAQMVADGDNALPAAELTDATLRQTVHLSLGGAALRVRISNAFGAQPMKITSAHVAQAAATDSSAIVAGSDHALTFAGEVEVIVPAGGEVWSDPVELKTAALDDLSVSLHLAAPPARETGHPGSHANSWLAHGDQVSAASLPGARRIEHWWFLSGVDVAATAGASTVVAFGDSITDGHGSTADRNDRWPDDLARRLQAAPAGHDIGVVNTGIGGNRVLQDGLGPSALARFDRDVLSQSGVRSVIMLEGVNDIGVLTRDAPVTPQAHDAMVHHITDAYAQMIAAAHARGVRVLGGTILPYIGSGYYHPGAASEADRQAINTWIRASGHFDGVVDFDLMMRDPAHPEMMQPQFDSGDHLHPSPAGYRAMALAIPLGALIAPDARTAKQPIEPAAKVAAPAGALQIAFTFDDLPAHSSLPPGDTRLSIVEHIAAALKAADAPQVYGFVNGVREVEEPASDAALPAWRAAGFPLGNHTWSHMNLNAGSTAAFEEDVLRDEPLLKSEAGGTDWRWFRYPFLAEADDAPKRAAVRGFLARRGYRIAGVTMGFSDYAFNEPYARCVAKGDQATVARMEQTYLAAAADAVDYGHAAATSLYGHDIPYVLLMHAGAFDARMMPRLLAFYRARGFHFVTLDQAEADPFYASDMDPQSTAPDTLEAALAAKGLPQPAHKVDLGWLETACR